MKNFTPALTIVLTVAVAILFYLHFSSKSPAALAAQQSAPGTPGNFRIAYFDHDSLENHYEYYKEVKATLQQLEQQKSNELGALRNAYQSKLKEYQSRGATMTPAEQQGAQQDLMQRDKDYQQAEQLKSQEMQNEALQKLQEVNKTIEAYLKEYNKGKGYAFILSSSPDQNLMYYKDTVYNITNEIVKGLNEQHKKH